MDDEQRAQIQQARLAQSQALGQMPGNVIPDTMALVARQAAEIERLRAALRGAVTWLDKNEQYAEPEWYIEARAALGEDGA